MPDCICPLKEAAKDAPHSLALITPGQTFTFSQLDQLADRFSPHIPEKSLIAVFHPPCAELIALFFSVWRIGGVLCPLNLYLPEAQLALALQRLGHPPLIRAFPFPTLPASPTPLEPGLLLFTSGSTAAPKIAVLPLSSLRASALSFPVVDLQPNDRWLLSLPLYHVGGIGILLRCILARATITLAPSDPEITHLSAVPTQLYRATPVYKKLKTVLLGGAPLQQIPTYLPIIGTYGLTEMSSWVTALRSPVCIDGVVYLGTPLAGRELKIAPDGEIWVRGTTLFRGYFPLQEEVNDWFATKDLGRLHPIHGLAILGRKDWQFISGGENIQPEEIEGYLLQIPAVIEAVVFPQEDPEFGQRPVAWVRTSDPSLTQEKVQMHLCSCLPKYKIPKEILFVDHIPKVGLKIDRTSLYRARNNLAHGLR